jgi:hypothetical protein
MEKAILQDWNGKAAVQMERPLFLLLGGGRSPPLPTTENSQRKTLFSLSPFSLSPKVWEK